MKIRETKKFLMITISLLVLVGCDNYEFVNKDEYLVVKKDETKEYSKEINWDDLNILSTVTIKYIGDELHYRIVVRDLDKVPILETDYYENLIQGSQVLIFSDMDDFRLHKITVPFGDFDWIMTDDGKVSHIEGQGSVEFDQSKYSKIHDIRIGTADFPQD